MKVYSKDSSLFDEDQYKVKVKVCPAKNKIVGYVGGRELYSMMTIMGKWVVSSSTCLPSDVRLAKAYSDCINEVFKTWENLVKCDY